MVIQKRRKLLLVVGILLLAANMRAPLTAVGAVAPIIEINAGLSKAAIGLLTTIPLISFSIASVLAILLIKNIGILDSVLSGTVLILLGEIIRSFSAVSGLYIGTLLIGFGIGLENVAMVVIIKTFFLNRIRIMTSFYTSIMSLFGGIGSWVSISLMSKYGLNWNTILSVWIPAILLTVIIWIIIIVNQRYHPEFTCSHITKTKYQPKKSLFLYLTLYVGMQSLLFYCVLSWLPSILKSLGIESNYLGLLIFLNQTISIPSGFIIPILADKKKSTPLLIIASGIFLATGILLLMLPRHNISTLIGVILIAIGLGSSFSMGVVLINLKTENAEESSRLAGIALAVGYLLASVGPFFIGFTYDQLNSWVLPLLFLILIAAMMVGVGLKIEN